jgi:tRNA dimethylallyltransferase
MTADAPLVVILGPTASGKTALSLALAERFAGEIVSCDSVSIYRELMIGTAKPTEEERRRAPHHLLDLVSPDEPFTAGDYARLARQTLKEISGRGRLPIVAGGSGLYLRALIEGLFAGPQRSEELRRRLRRRVRERGSEYLHRLLARLDRPAAVAIHPNDAPKLIRALEVCLLVRQPMTELWRQGREPLRGFRVLRLGLNPERSLLYERINQRARRMFEAGLVEETRELLARYGTSQPFNPDNRNIGVSWDSPAALSSLGYRQAAQLLRGELTRDEASAAAQQGHRNYAKRQMTWFRREPEVCWMEGFGDDERVQQECVERVARFLESAPGTPGTAT